MVPKKIFFTKGVGKHKERLTSFELALRDAGIASQNLVRVSSIFPPRCKMLTRKEGLTNLSPGEVVFAVVAENSTHEPHRLLAASIGVAIPADRNTYGYLSEHHSFGETEDASGDYAEELAAEMLATTLNVEFDPDRSWDEKKEIYRISNKIVRTANVTQSAVGDKRGMWTTVIAAAIFIFEEEFVGADGSAQFGMIHNHVRAFGSSNIAGGNTQFIVRDINPGSSRIDEQFRADIVCFASQLIL